MTPILHTSTAFPYGFCAKTSGAINKKNIYLNFVKKIKSCIKYL